MPAHCSSVAAIALALVAFAVVVGGEEALGAVRVDEEQQPLQEEQGHGAHCRQQ